MREEQLPIATVRASFHHHGFGGLVQPAVSEDLGTVLKTSFRRKKRISFHALCSIFTTRCTIPIKLSQKLEAQLIYGTMNKHCTASIGVRLFHIKKLGFFSNLAAATCLVSNKYN